MTPEGWTSYELRRPPDVLCRFVRFSDLTEQALICKPSEFRPEMNIAGLYWRLTGIGRKEFEGWNEQQHAMYQSSNGWLGNVATAITKSGLDLVARGMF